MDKIRVILIEDSSLMRLVTGDLLKREESIELVSVAKNAKEGIEQVLLHKPDVLITDYLMPEHDGLYVVKEIMKLFPLPIIVLSGLDKATSEIFEVLKAGAYEFLEKPKNGGLLPEGNPNPLIRLIFNATSSNVNLDNLIQQKKNINVHQHTFDSINYQIIVIGASTGGPSAVESVLQNLPSNLTIPVVIVQHMPKTFLVSFAKRLDSISPLKVMLAEDGMKLKGGEVYILPGQNMKVKKGLMNCFSIDNEKYIEYDSPSVDGLFLSVAQVYKEKAIGVILTGMGRDGTRGIIELRKQGAYTIAQDQNSSIVYGMPKSAYDSGKILQSVSLNEIPNFLISCL